LFAASAAVAVCILVACSAFDAGDASTPASDAGSSPALDGSGSDDAVAATLPPVNQKCTADKKVGDAVLVKGLGLGSCFTLSVDEKTAYFTQNHEVHAARWSAETASVGAPIADLHISTTTDGGLGCTASTNDGRFVFNEDLFNLFRQESLDGGGYGHPKLVPPTGLPERDFIGRPFVDRVTSDLYVTVVNRDHFLEPPYGVARAVIRGDGTATAFAAVNIGDDISASFPVIAGDSKAIYYMSTAGQPTDQNGLNQHIHVATRETPLDKFTPFRALTELDGPAGSGEAPTYITSDGCSLFFTSSRGLDSGIDRQIYVATRSP
jgi:hypothetical protein